MACFNTMTVDVAIPLFIAYVAHSTGAIGYLNLAGHNKCLQALYHPFPHLFYFQHMPLLTILKSSVNFSLGDFVKYKSERPVARDYARP